MKIPGNLFFLNIKSHAAGALFFIAAVSFFAAVFTRCSKDDESDEQERRELTLRSILGEIRTDSLQSYVEWLEGMGTRFALANNHRNVAAAIKRKFQEMGYPGTRLDSFYITKTYRNVTYRQWQHNVIAMIRGTEYPDSACILGSHYDDIVGTGDPFILAPGAHDNASGTAATIEVARVLKKKGFAPQKTIVFIAFGAEELGLIGSQHYSANPGEFAGKISFMLNNDMIGYDPDQNPAMWQLNILDYSNSQGLRAEAQKMIQKYTSLGFINDNRYNKQSDSYPFALWGYRALFFSSVKNDPYYHTDNDLSSNLNFAYLREIARISCALIAEKNY